jgi:hypothetical protein
VAVDAGLAPRVLGDDAGNHRHPGSPVPLAQPCGSDHDTSVMDGEDQRPKGDRPDPEATAEEERTASRDLADGLDLMMRAARKAMRGFDPAKLEDLGRRAVRSVESLDAKQVSEFGRKAARNLDPRKIEEVAQDAGRELMNVIERVSDRIDGLVSNPRGKNRDEDDEAAPKARVRVDDED